MWGLGFQGAARRESRTAYTSDLSHELRRRKLSTIVSRAMLGGFLFETKHAKQSTDASPNALRLRVSSRRGRKCFDLSRVGAYGVSRISGRTTPRLEPPHTKWPHAAGTGPRAAPRNHRRAESMSTSERPDMDQTERGEHERNKLRGAISEVTLRVSELSAKGESDSAVQRVETLERAWQSLIELIQPEAEPTRRECPHCHQRMRQVATRCLYCLAKSAPPDHGLAGAA